MTNNVFVTYQAQERRGDMFYQGIIANATMIIDRPIDCTEVVRAMEKKIKEECVKNGVITEQGKVIVTNWRRFEESEVSDVYTN